MTSIGDVEVRAIIKFCVGIEKTPTETYKMIQASSTTKKCCRSLVFRWHDMFRNGRESIEDDKRCGRPSVVKSGVKDKVRQLLNEDRRRTVREMSSELGVSVSTVHDCLKEDNMSKVSARWVPRLLKNDERECRLRCSHEFVQRVEREGVAFLDRIITTDETWLFHFDPESKQESSIWKTPGSPPPKKARVQKSGGKHMFVFFMDRRGMLLQHRIPEGQTVTADYYSKVIYKIYFFLI
jgi:hypothetical protein